MAYSAPTITSTGLTIPSYNDILTDMIDKAKTIYGQDIYLGTDSMDYQFLSIFASKSYDIMQLLQMVYNNRGPSTAIGSALDGIVKLNGISRKQGTYSTCNVTLTGTASTQINNGVVQDITGYKWNLPTVVTIESGGSVTVTATSQTTGTITANSGDINIIVTPTYGWTSVTNSTAATTGTNTEKDSELRARQAISVAPTGLTVLNNLKESIAALANVTRYKVYENDTNATDSDGLVAHSIAAVVEGGTNASIASAIFSKKAPGVFTQGTISEIVVDTYGQSNTIRFYRPAVVDVDIVITVKKLAGYTTQTNTDTKTKLASYLNTLTIGDDITISSLWGAALSAMTSLYTPSFSITSLTAARHLQTQGTANIPIAFNEVSRGNTAYITVIETV